MMKQLLLIISLVMFINIYAQDVKFYGMVTDSIGNPLVSASLVAANAQTKAFQGYSITDEKGYFEILLKQNALYVVKITFMGYQSVLDKVNTQAQNIVKKYVLKEDKQQLAGVELKYEMPVSIKGDTISYSADAFTTGNEKKLKDVLKKVPGVEVDTDGTVKVEGKEVKKVLVEGKEFFGGDSKLAAKNIPANAVKKIQVLRNYNENSQTKRFEDNQDSYAINIKLKEGKKNFWFGEMSAGGGYKDRYLFHPKLFYYSKKNTYNILLDANNIGTVPMTWRDYYKFTGSFINLFRRSGSNKNSNDNVLGISLRQNDQAKATTSKFGAFNFNNQVSNSLNLKGFLILNAATTDMLTETKKDYTQNNIHEISEENTYQDTKLIIGKITTSYDPNPNFSLKYNFLAKKSFLEESDSQVSNIRANNTTQNKQEPFSLDQNLEIFKTLKNENLISFALQYKNDQDQPFFEAISTDEFFATSSLINMQPQQTFDLLQNKSSNNKQVNSLFDYYYVLNAVSHLDFSIGNEYSNQRYDSFMQQKLDNGFYNNFDNLQLQNNAHYTYADFFAGLHYKLKWHKMIITPGANLHYYALDNEQYQVPNKETLVSLLPDLAINYRFKQSISLNFNYSLSNTFSDITKYIQGYVLSNFNSLEAGNPDIKNVYKHNFSLNYSEFNMLKFKHLFGRLSYTHAINPIKNTTRIEQTDFISYPININHADDNLSGSIGLGRRYVKWQYRLSGGINWMKYYSKINDQELSSTSLSQNYNSKISSNFEGFFNFDIGYKISLNKFDNMLRNTLYITDQPYANIEFSLFDQQLLLSLDYNYYNYRDQQNTTHNKYAFMDTKLYYQTKGSQWEFVLTGTNLLSTLTLNKENLTDLYIATSKYYVQPNYWLLTVKYNL